MTTMHDIYEKDLGGPRHENPQDCKAPAMLKAMREIIEQAKAGDTCVFTAIINVLTWAYGIRFVDRGVAPDDYIKTVENGFYGLLAEVTEQMEKECLHRNHRTH